METDTERHFETLGQAAARLLGRLDARGKKPSGESPEPIQIGGGQSGVPAEAPPKADRYSPALKAFGVPALGGGAVRRLLVAANDEFGLLAW